MRCCSAWAAPASVPKCWRRPLAPARAFPGCTCSIPPIRRRYAISTARSISRAPCSSFPANLAARSNPISSSNISGSAPRRRSVKPTRHSISSRSPTRVRRSKNRRRKRNSARCFTACRRSADATRCCPTSAWCRPRRAASRYGRSSNGHPVVRITVSDKMQLGQEFFRWEMATAVAGSVLGINPFDQPDVEAQKVKTRELTAAYEKTGKLPPEEPFFTADGIALYADPENAAALKPQATSLAAALKAHLARVHAGDYVALLAYIERNAAHTEALQRLRRMIRDRTRAATCLGFGPRFLHSTGQAYKGGPNTGVFLQMTCDIAEDLPVPGQRYSFGIVKAAQARGDFDVLAERGRRLLRVHLPADVEGGLRTFAAALEKALQ